jgi:hypothetical protein
LVIAKYESENLEASELNAMTEARLQIELNELLIRNEVVWRQKSQGSLIYQQLLGQRRNSIDAIIEDPGRWILNKKKIREHLVEIFNWANCY